MIGEPTNDDRSDVMKRAEPPFAVPLAYERMDDNALGPAARTLGLACVVLGTLRFFIATPLEVLITFYAR